MQDEEQGQVIKSAYVGIAAVGHTNIRHEDQKQQQSGSSQEEQQNQHDNQNVIVIKKN